jgi:glucokinase
MNQTPDPTKSDATIGIDVGGTGVRAVAVLADGQRAGKVHRAPLKSRERSEVLGRIVDVVAQATAEVSGTVAGIGVGLPAFLELPEGIVRLAPNLPELNGWKAAEELETALRCPVAVENDANAAAFGEHWLGVGAGRDPFLLLTLGTGVGGGIVLNGEVLHGRRGMAAELGHITVYPDGAPCGCGARGCLEAHASATAIVRMFMEETARMEEAAFREVYGPREDVTAQALAELAARGDTPAFTAFARAGTALGIAVGTLVHVFDPAAVALGGNVAAAWDLLFPSLWEELLARASLSLRDGFALLPASLGSDAGAVGAAGLAWRRVQTA